MSFQNAEAESRRRLTESGALLSHLRASAPQPLRPLDEIGKALRGLWIVSIYAAVERSVNAFTEAAIETISAHNNDSLACTPSLHSIFHHSRVQSLRDCSRGVVFDKSVSLFEASLSESKLVLTDNPLAASLQNIDTVTMNWVLGLFGAPRLQLTAGAMTRVNVIRERRNAVEHGRESAAQVGERYTIQDLQDVYNAVDEVLSAFHLSLSEHCTQKRYLRQIA